MKVMVQPEKCCFSWCLVLLDPGRDSSSCSGDWCDWKESDFQFLCDLWLCSVLWWILYQIGLEYAMNISKDVGI